MSESVPLPLPAAALTANLTLAFTLPPSLRLCVGPGRWRGPCIHQARVDVGADGAVEIRAFNGSDIRARQILFQQAERFIITIAGGRKNLPVETFCARLSRHEADGAAEQSTFGGPRYRTYAIVTGAAISITHAFEPPELVA